MSTVTCTYELYQIAFKEARAAVRAGNVARLDSLRARAGVRSGAARAAVLLAVGDAQAEASRRSKIDVCRPLCETRCERGV